MRKSAASRSLTRCARNASAFLRLCTIIAVLLPLTGSLDSSVSARVISPPGQSTVLAATTSTSPIAAFKLSASYGKAPLKVTFDASDCKAVKGRTIAKYVWDFGDGVKGTGAKTSHTFTTVKLRTVKLTVTDSKGSSASTTHTVDVGNTPPAPAISSPTSGTLFVTGGQLKLAGSAKDPEEGTLSTTRLTWQVAYKHGTATTTLLAPTKGNNLVVPIPQPAEVSTAATSTITVSLTATDSHGLQKTVTRTFKPKLVSVNIVTSPPGANVRVGDVAVTGPGSVQIWGRSTVQLSAIGGVGADGQPLQFSSWSDNGAANHGVGVPLAGLTLTANFTSAIANPFAPIADATVNSSQPNSNDGTSSVLTVQSSSPRERVYLKFNVAAAGTIVSAKLYLYALTTSIYTPAIFRTSNDWTEMGLTWANRPAEIGSPLPGANGVSAGSWTVFDVTGAIESDGTVSFVLLRDIKTSAQFVSREGGAHAPRLMIETSDKGEPVAVPAPTNVGGEPFSANAIDLHWDSPAPVSGLTGYDIERDGMLITAIGAETTYRDLGLAPKTTYSYRLRARSADGVSEWTAPVAITTPPVTTDNIVIAKSSTFVSEDPNVVDDYQDSTLLRVQGGSNPSTETYLKFKLPALTGPAYRTELKIYIPASTASQPGGSISLYGSTNWELGMTWVNRTGRHPIDPYDTATNLPSGDWVTLVPPDGALGNREVTYVLATDSNALTYIGRSGAFAPRLVIIALEGNTSAAAASSPSSTPAQTATTESSPAPTETASSTTTPLPTDAPASPTEQEAATPSPTDDATPIPTVVSPPTESPTPIPAGSPPPEPAGSDA